MKIPLDSLLNATVGLDTTVLKELGFELEESPHLEGAQLVTNNIPPTVSQWIAAGLMTAALLVVCLSESSSRQGRHPKFAVWMMGLVSSWFHNVDNILRPGTYFTPSWIVTPKVAFPMDYGFLFWLGVMALGVLALRDTCGTQMSPIVLILHSLGTSFGVMHYVAQSPLRFSVLAHASILLEVVMGIVVGVVLWTTESNIMCAFSQGFYQSVPRVVEEPQHHDMSSSMELPERRGLRQRSVSPKVWK